MGGYLVAGLYFKDFEGNIVIEKPDGGDVSLYSIYEVIEFLSCSTTWIYQKICIEQVITAIPFNIDWINTEYFENIIDGKTSPSLAMSYLNEFCGIHYKDVQFLFDTINQKQSTITINKVISTEIEKTNTLQEIVTVDAALWETSCRAACSVLVEIVGSGERGITNAVFLERMKALAPGKRTHTKADKIAWKALPDRHKNGPGCPKK